MSRSFVLGNGNILVGLDEHGQVKDFYYPYVGMENHACGQAHKLGIWVDGIFTWLDNPSWKKQLTYKKETLVTEIKVVNDGLKIEILFNDTVDNEKNVFIRHVTIINNASHKREIRFFFHQIFIINQSNYGDTVYYNPQYQSLIHYKSKRYFLINACHLGDSKSGISSYACGLAGQYGNQGSWVDAEDGILSNNSIEHGSVDSILSLNFFLESSETTKLCYWICIGENIEQVSHLNTFVLENNDILITRNETFYQEWVNRTPFEFRGLSERVIDLFKRSLLIIRAHTDNNGAIIASSDSNTLLATRDSYSYMWPRDGALISRSLDRGGYFSLTQNFFTFCMNALTKEGYLFHKYLPDGSLGSTWHSWLHEGHIQLPIQEDETAIVIYALWKHYLINHNEKFVYEIYKNFIERAADFLVKYIDPTTGLPKESYDIWEEKLGIHTYTCCTVYAGLQAASYFFDLFDEKEKSQLYAKTADTIKNSIIRYLYDPSKKIFIKGLYYHNGQLHRDTTNDASSFYGIFEYQILDSNDPRVISHFEILKKDLFCDTKIGGYARYENDYYYRKDQIIPGNPWFITILWLAEYYIEIAKTEQDFKPVLDIFEWVAKHAQSSGILSEQIDPHTGYQLSVAPLTWSHAAYVTAVTKYLEKLDDLKICKICNPVVLKKIPKKEKE